MNKELIKTTETIYREYDKNQLRKDYSWYPLTEHEKEIFKCNEYMNAQDTLIFTRDMRILELEKEIGELHKEHKHFSDDCRVCKAVIDVECNFRTNKLKEDILNLKENKYKLEKENQELQFKLNQLIDSTKCVEANLEAYKKEVEDIKNVWYKDHNNQVKLLDKRLKYIGDLKFGLDKQRRNVKALNKKLDEMHNERSRMATILLDKGVKKW